MAGEIAEAILAGFYCQICGDVMDDMFDENTSEPGYPRSCPACVGMEDAMDDDPPPRHTPSPSRALAEQCHMCRRRFAGTISLKQHMRDKHGVTG